MAALLVLPAVLLAGCGDDLPASRGVSGTVRVDGSSTVTPLVRAAADELVAEVEPGLTVTLTTSGTTAGVARLCAGEADVAMASRPLTDEETGACTAAGVDVVAVPVGLDAVSVVVPARNDFVGCLTVAEVAAVLAGAGPDAPATWADVRGGWPATTLVPFAPGSASGTADLLREEVLDGAPLRAGVATSEDDDVLVQGVAASPGGVGVVPLTYALGDAVRPVALDAGDGCVAPSADSVQDGTYPLARELVVHVSRAAYADEPAVAAFVDHLAARADAVTEDVGGVPRDAGQVEAAQQALDDLGGPAPG